VPTGGGVGGRAFERAPAKRKAQVMGHLKMGVEQNLGPKIPGTERKGL